MMKSNSKAILLFFGIIFCFQAAAQKDFQFSKQMLTVKQEEALKALGAEMDNKINLAFRGNEKIKMEMQNALNKIISIKNTILKKSELSAYQNKYLKIYGDILKKGSVSMEYYAAKYQQILPAYKFTVSNNYAITANLSEAVTGSSSFDLLTVTTTTQIGDFDNIKSNPCGLAAGGNVNFTSNSMDANSVAAVAGGCIVEGTMAKEVDLKSARKASAKIKYSARVDGFVIAVVGVSSVNMSVTGRISALNAVEYRPELYNLIFHTSCYIIAPLLWALQGDAFEADTKTINLTTGYRYNISFNAYVNTLSVLFSETNGSAKLSDLQVDLTTE